MQGEQPDCAIVCKSAFVLDPRKTRELERRIVVGSRFFTLLAVGGSLVAAILMSFLGLYNVFAAYREVFTEPVTDRPFGTTAMASRQADRSAQAGRCRSHHRRSFRLVFAGRAAGFGDPNISLSWTQVATFALLPVCTALLALSLRLVELHPKPPSYDRPVDSDGHPPRGRPAPPT